MADGLQKLFGSAARVKLLRLFLFNPRQSFTCKDTCSRARVSEDDTRSEIALFCRVGLIERSHRGKGVRYGLRGKFEYTTALQNLLLNAPARGEDILERMRGLGPLKFIALSGIFVGEWEGNLDVLFVGDRVKERKLRERVKRLEAELGKEVKFALLTSEDFLYRLNMNDRLVRDVLDYSHRIVLDKLDTGLKTSQ